MPAEPPDAGTARRRARTGVCLLGALLVLPFTVGALPGAREAGAPLGLLTGTLAFVLYGMLVEESTPARHSMRRITARTLTGTRSVDLVPRPSTGGPTCCARPCSAADILLVRVRPPDASRP
ncbi:hypothetical protein [Streptomyces heilongjiangensis]|uniref:Uncharacterized protein n=1 Tax=Streptomyces heilongjiangensis TaxID=945052 RepID=A0ABW1BJG2_9ACTN|nr:hypothetical protein [Streptomyces heilongjiangensis]MDC2952323.1 hypothetical protein [Streptomyces heilongjiangensis]